MRNRFFVCLLAVFAVGLAAGIATAQSDCKADLKVSYAGQDDAKDPGYVDHVFAIEVKADTRCATVDYKLTVVEKPRDGEMQTNVKQYSQKVRDNESKARKVKYRLSRDVQVEDYGFEVTGCRPCGL